MQQHRARLVQAALAAAFMAGAEQSSREPAPKPEFTEADFKKFHAAEMKRARKAELNRRRKNEVLSEQVRRSLKPGELMVKNLTITSESGDTTSFGAGTVSAVEVDDHE